MRWKGNAYIGVIMSVFLVLFGCMGITNNFGRSIFTYDNSHVIAVEQLTGIEIPDEYIDILTKTFERYGDEAYGTETKMLIDETQADTFREAVEKDDRWLNEVPEELTDVLHYVGRSYIEGNYSLLYCSDTDSFNKLPEENGLHHFIQIIFSPESRMFMIYEYEADPAK